MVHSNFLFYCKVRDMHIRKYSMYNVHCTHNLHVNFSFIAKHIPTNTAINIFPLLYI